MLNRSTLMNAHVLLAAFILPVAIMFFVTGALYTWGIKGSYVTDAYKIDLLQPMQDERSELVALVKKELASRDLEPPRGQPKVKRMGSSFRLEWTGSNMDIILEPTSEPLVAKLAIKTTSLHRPFVQLHKAKGGEPFKVYATVFSIALLLLLVSGFMMAWQMPKLRKLAAASALLSVSMFVVMVVVS
jgi:hypothetical protein